MLKRPILFAVTLTVQTLCAVFFVVEILLTVFQVPIQPIPWIYHEVIEVGAALGLILGSILGAVLLRNSLRRTRVAEEALRLASGAFMDVVDTRFGDWGLTPAERDVALFALKGMSIAEIAELRATSTGTVKAQTNAIYRKAGVSGRTQLLSVFVDDLMGDSIAEAASSPAPSN
ncbi:MAG: LuxR C-terminal-related transcriptional regulator [Pseudomonadota bacterium]